MIKPGRASVLSGSGDDDYDEDELTSSVMPILYLKLIFVCFCFGHAAAAMMRTWATCLACLWTKAWRKVCSPTKDRCTK
jgi:hypothetical protein